MNQPPAVGERVKRRQQKPKKPPDEEGGWCLSRPRCARCADKRFRCWIRNGETICWPCNKDGEECIPSSKIRSTAEVPSADPGLAGLDFDPLISGELRQGDFSATVAGPVPYSQTLFHPLPSLNSPSGVDFSSSTPNPPSASGSGIPQMSVTQREIFEAIRLAAPPNERLAECLAYLLDDYHISRNITPFNTVAKSISADDLPNVDRMAVYILLTWAEMRPVRDSSVIQSVSSIVKYSTDDVTGNDCIALIIHFHAVCDSTPDTVICDSCYEWFICHNSTNKPTRKTLKDLLVMGKAVSGLMPPDQAPFQIIMFHEGKSKFSTPIAIPANVEEGDCDPIYESFFRELVGNGTFGCYPAVQPPTRSGLLGWTGKAILMLTAQGGVERAWSSRWDPDAL